MLCQVAGQRHPCPGEFGHQQRHRDRGALQAATRASCSIRCATADSDSAPTFALDDFRLCASACRRGASPACAACCSCCTMTGASSRKTVTIWVAASPITARSSSSTRGRGPVAASCRPGRHRLGAPAPGRRQRRWQPRLPPALRKATATTPRSGGPSAAAARAAWRGRSAGQVIVHPRLQAALAVAGHGVGGHCDDRQSRTAGFCFFGTPVARGGVAIQHRHLAIHQYDVHVTSGAGQAVPARHRPHCGPRTGTRAAAARPPSG